MFPLSLTLRNFLSYRDAVTIDFSSVRVACLSGENGAGKSAILDAMTWALWGKARVNNDRNLIALGTTEMDVDFCFSLAGMEHRVFRRRSYRGTSMRTSVELFTRAPGAQEWSQITGDSTSGTQQKINQLLNMEYDTFVNSAFIMQGQADSFTQKTAGDRKKLLAEILDLQQYDDLTKMARDRCRTENGRLSEVRKQMDNLDLQLVERVRVEDDLNVTAQELITIGDQLDSASQLESALKQQIEHQKHLREYASQAQKRYVQAQQALAQTDARISTAKIEQASLQALMAQAAEINAGYTAWQQWRAEADRLTTLRQEVQQRDNARRDAERSIAEAEHELQLKRRNAENRARTSAERLQQLAQLEDNLTVLRAQQAQAPTAEQRDALQRQIDDAVKERAILSAESKHQRATMNEMQENLDRLLAGDAGCPVCRRPLSEPDRLRIEQEWRADGKRIGDSFRLNSARAKTLDESVTSWRQTLQQLEAGLRQAQTRQGQINQMAAQLAGRDGAQADLEAAQHELAQIDATIETGDFAHEAHQALAQARAALSTLAWDPQYLADAVQHVREYAPFEARLRELDLAEARLGGVEQALANDNTLRAQQQQTLQDAQDELEEAQARITDDPDLQQRWRTALAERDRLDGERTALVERNGELKARIEALDALQDDRDKLDDEATILEDDITAYTALTNAFGRKGIQAMVIKSVVPELEDEANRLLRQMASDALHVSLRTEQESITSDRVSETLEIVIRDEQGERPYDLYSGGEAFRINFAVRVALSRLLARRAGASVEMLVIDEGFGTQDSHGRDGLIEALRSVERDFHTILVITHISEIRDYFPTRIDVVKTDRGSQVTVA